MDDQTPFDLKQRSSTEENWHKEQERRSFDVIRVKNPTNKDYVVEWGKPATYHRVPANGTADVFRYIATKYCRDMKDLLINEFNQKKHDEEIAERRKKGLAQFESKWHENEATYARPDYKKTNDVKEAVAIYSELWVGLVSEFGKDQPVQTGSFDNIPTSDEIKALESVANRKISDIEEKPVIDESKPEVAVKMKPAKVDQTTNKDAVLADIINSDEN